MRPSVARKLMSLSVHTTYDSRPWRRRIINGFLVKIDTSHEKGSLEIVRGKKIEKLISIDVWAIIVRHGNLSRLSAHVDAFTPVQDISQLGTSNIACRSSGWELVRVGSGAIVKETVRSLAVVLALSAITRRRATVSFSTGRAAEVLSASSISAPLTSLKLRCMY